MVYGLRIEYFLKCYCYLQIFNNHKILFMNILNARPGFGKSMPERQLEDFLDKSIIQIHIGTLDDKKDPNIHPVWYHYEPLS